MTTADPKTHVTARRMRAAWRVTVFVNGKVAHELKLPCNPKAKHNHPTR